jgi:hypothetical protein
LQGQPTSFESARSTGSSSNLRYVLAQDKKLADAEKKYVSVKEQIVGALELLDKEVTGKTFGTKILKSFLSLIAAVFNSSKLIDFLNGNLANQLKSKLQTVTKMSLSDTPSATQVKPASNYNLFVKTSQFDSMSASGIGLKTVSLATSVAVGVLIINYFRANIVKLANNPAELIKSLSLGLSYIFELISKEFLVDFFGSTLQRDDFFYDKEGKPIRAAFAQFDLAVDALNGSREDAQAIITLEQAITRKIKSIDELESAVNSQIERDVQAGSENKMIRAPADSGGKLAQSIDSLNKLIGEAFNDSIVLISLYDKLLVNKDKQGIDPINVSFIGLGRRRAKITEEKLRSKRQRYASLSVIKEEIARYIRLNMLLGPIMARIKKFNNLGMSPASLISGSKSNPESLLKAMNEIRKNEQVKIDKVQKKINEIKARVPAAESYTERGYIGI